MKRCFCFWWSLAVAIVLLFSQGRKWRQGSRVPGNGNENRCVQRDGARVDENERASKQSPKPRVEEVMLGTRPLPGP